MSDHRPAVSARGVLDGDPTALAGLCDLRGPSVVAYCQAVCGVDAAVDAAAQAFGAFRAAAVHATRPLTLNPDAVLLAKAREAAAARAPDPSGGVPRPDDPLCPDVPRLLATDAAHALDPAERHHLRRHLARCVHCRRAQNAQREAERAYVHPPVRALPPIARQAMISALRHAAPIASAAPAPGPRPPSGPAARPTAQLDGGVDADPGAGPAPARPDEAPSAQPTGARTPPTPPPQPPTPHPPIPVPRKHPPARPERPVEVQTGVIPLAQVAAALGYAEADEPAATAGRRPDLRGLVGRLPGARVLAPAAVLIVALLVVLGVAGVFSSGRPSPSPASSTGPTGAGSTATTRTNTYDHSPAAHARRLRAAARRRAARLRAAEAAARARAAPAAIGTTKTGTVGPTTSAAAPTGRPAAAPPPAAPTGRPAAALAAPAAAAPPDNGAPPAAGHGYKSD